MNAPPAKRLALWPTLIGIVGSFLLMAILVWAMQRYIQSTPINQARIEERKKALAEARATTTDALNHYGWTDQGKELVRLKMDRAMELVIQEYKNPTAFRSNMLRRVEKATAAPPPMVNPFE